MFILIRISSWRLLKRAGWQLIWESNPLLPNQVFGSTLTTALMASQNSREFNFHWEDGTPKSVMKHVSWAVGLVRIFPHLYCRRGSHFHQDHLEICAKWTKLIFISLEDWFHISQRWFEPILPLLCCTELWLVINWPSMEDEKRVGSKFCQCHCIFYFSRTLVSHFPARYCEV